MMVSRSQTAAASNMEWTTRSAQPLGRLQRLALVDGTPAGLHREDGGERVHLGHTSAS